MIVILVVLLALTKTSADIFLTQDNLESLFARFIDGSISESERETFARVLELAREHRPAARSFRSINTGQDPEIASSRATMSCLICRGAFAGLIRGVNSGQTDERLIDMLSIICSSLGLQSANTCRGTISLNIPILTYIIKNTQEAYPSTFCGILLQNADNPQSCPIEDPRFEWTVDLPELSEVVQTTAPSSTETENIKIALLTDTHIDPLYEPNSEANCDEPVCCRKGQKAARNYIFKSQIDDDMIKESIIEKDGEKAIKLGLLKKKREKRKRSKVKLRSNDNKLAGYWGDYRNCDTPIWTFDNVIDEICHKHKNIQMMYYIGDTVDHAVWHSSYKLIEEVNTRVREKITDNCGAKLPVFVAIGNHDSHPSNQFAPSNITDEKINTTWLYDTLADKWGQRLSSKAIKQFRKMGGYSQSALPGLRVVSLNNNVAYRYNWWLVYDPLDSKRHLEWLVKELYKAEQLGDKVHILAHIPPGSPDLTYTWTREYNRIVNRFSSTIAAEFNGHMHSDEFKIFYDADGNPTNVAWGGGGATTYPNYNVNYKTLLLDQNLELADIKTYGYNLTAANLKPNQKPKWRLLYDMRHRYNLTDLSTKTIDNLVRRSVTSERQILDIYSAFYSKLSDAHWPWCDVNCKLNNICDTVVTVLWDRKKCDELKSLYYSAKDDGFKFMNYLDGLLGILNMWP